MSDSATTAIPDVDTILRGQTPDQLAPGYRPPLPNQLQPQPQQSAQQLPPQLQPRMYTQAAPQGGRNYTVGPVQPGDPGYQPPQPLGPPQQSPAPWAVPPPAQVAANRPSPPPAPYSVGNQPGPWPAAFPNSPRFDPLNAPALPGETPQETAALNYHMGKETQGRNIMNDAAARNPALYTDPGNPRTCQGYWQIVNSTWRDGAQKAGVDLRVWPTAMAAPYGVQRQVALALYRAYGDKPWQAPPGAGEQGDRFALRPQQPLPSQPRDYPDWGKDVQDAPPRDFGQGPPGQQQGVPDMQPGQSGFTRVLNAVGPLLLAIGSLALRLPLSSAITAYGAMARAQDNGQREAYQRNRQQALDQLNIATQQQTLESRDASDAFVEYGSNNPVGLQQELARIALKYNDPVMFRLAEAGQLNRIHQLQQQRDVHNQDLTKLGRQADDERDRKAINDDVAARDAQWDRENPNATPEQRAIAHAQHVGEAEREVLGSKTADGTKEIPGARDVIGADGKPTGQQVRQGTDGGYYDPDTNERVHLKPGETTRPQSTKAPAQPDIPPGWVKPGTKVPPVEPDQPEPSDQQPQPTPVPAGQGDQGGDQGGDQQPDPGDQGAADQQQPYQVASTQPTPPPSQQPYKPPPQAYPGPKYAPPDEMQQLGPNGDQTARQILRGNENAVKLAPKAVQPLIAGGANALQRQIDDVNRRAGLPEGDPDRLAPNQIMPALKDIDQGYADDLDSVLRYDRQVPSGSGFGSSMSPFWNSITNLAHKVDGNWMPQNYTRVHDYTNQQGKTFQTIQLTTTLASTGATVLRDVARIGKDFDPNAFLNAWNSWKSGKLEGDPRYTTLAADWQSFIIEANRLRTVSGSVVESEQQIGVLIPGRADSLLSSGVVPSNDRMFRDLIKNELANSYPKVKGYQEEWQALKPGVRMPGQAYIDSGVPTIEAILHMSPATGNYYARPVPEELQGSGVTIPADPHDAEALSWAQSHPDDPKSLPIIQGLREKGAF